jgi:FAD/FMN-containing dehydrogenase
VTRTPAAGDIGGTEHSGGTEDVVDHAVAWPGLLERLVAVVGHEHVVRDADVLAAYGRDWTGRFGVPPSLAVRPGDAAQTAAVLRACHDSRAPVVPQGGRTGLVGGSVPTAPGRVVLTTSRLDELSAVDVETGQVTAGAGVSLAALQRHAAAAGWSYGVDLAARDLATVGGTLATNAGGIRVVRHGDSRAQVLGVEAALADGSVLRRLQGWPKDSSGYDLSQLLVGSEGTLGVITAARLRLVRPLPARRLTVLFGVDTVGAALTVARSMRDVAGADGLLAAEFIVGAALDLVCEVAGLPFPLRRRWPVYGLVEGADVPPVEAVLASLTDAAVDRRVWEYRERQPEAMASLGVVHSLDVAVPLPRLDEFLDALPPCVADSSGGRATGHVFGHLAEGNLHVQVSGVAGGSDTPDAAGAAGATGAAGAPVDAVDEAVLRLVAALGGSISSEHGVGSAKTAWLPLSRSPEELAAMRALKRALDPSWVMNPGVVLPLP